jgi:hypothetical protein
MGTAHKQQTVHQISTVKWEYAQNQKKLEKVVLKIMNVEDKDIVFIVMLNLYMANVLSTLKCKVEILQEMSSNILTIISVIIYTLLLIK